MSRTKPKLVIPAGHLPSKTIDLAEFTPDGEHVLTSSDDGSMKLWDISGKFLKTFKITKSPTSIRFLNNVEFLLGFYEGVGEKWNLRTGMVEEIFSGLKRKTRFISKDGKKFGIAAGEQWGSGAEINQQFSIWDDQEKEHYTCEHSHKGAINDLVFSNDGKLAVTGSYDQTVKIWNISNESIEGADRGSVIRTIKGHTSDIERVAISPDNSKILSGARSGEINAWNAKTGDLIKSLAGHSTQIFKLVFAEDGASFITQCEEKIIKWDTETLNPIGKPTLLETYYNHQDRFTADLSQAFRAYYGQSSYLYEVSTGNNLANFKGSACEIDIPVISAPTEMLAFKSEDGFIRTWQLNTNQPTINLSIKEFLNDEHPYAEEIAIIPDTGNIVLRVYGGKVYIIDRYTFKSIEGPIQLPAKYDGIKCMSLSPDGKKLAFGVHENKEEKGNTAVIYDLLKKEVILDLPVTNDFTNVAALSFSNSGLELLVGTASGEHSGQISIWDTNQGIGLYTFPCGNQQWNDPKSVAWSSDDSKIVVSIENGWVYSWDLKTQTRKGFYPKVKRTKKSYDRATIVRFSPDGTKLVSGYFDSRTFIIWDYESESEIKVIEDHLSGNPDVFNALINFSEDSNIVFTCAGGNVFLLWDVHTGNKVASLYFLGNKDWAISTPSGLFDATEGAMEVMRYISGLEEIALEQLKDRYYEPGLLNQILDHGPQSLRDVNELNNVDLYPEVEATINVDQLNIKLTERSGGLGKVELYINGKTVWEDENKAKGTSFNIDLKNYNKYFSTREENTIAIRVYNEDGWLVSPEIIARRIDDAGAKAAGRGGNSKKKKRKRSKKIQHKLYALFIGTGTYRGKGMNLKYPEKDATAMAKAIEEVGQNLFGAANQDIRLLTTKATDKAKKPSRANIKNTLDDFASKAKADDVCFIYMSGHGDNWGSGEKAQFYYLTYEMISGDISDSGIRASQTISSSEIAEWTNKIACKLQVLVLDACHSGKVVDSLLAGKKTVDTARIKALDRMKDRTGMFVLAGSPGDKVSYETSHFGQGLLTYSLLFGMKGASHVIEGADKFIDVMKLLQYSRDRVPQLAKEIDKVQQPILATPKGGDSFDIGIYDTNVKINLASRRPIIIQSILMNKNSYYDDLEISMALDQRLLQENAYANTARLTFVNIPRFKNAYTVRGVYEEKGNNVEVDIKIYQEGKEKEKFKLSKAKTDIKNLVEDIVDKLALLPV